MHNIWLPLLIAVTLPVLACSKAPETAPVPPTEPKAPANTPATAVAPPQVPPKSADAPTPPKSAGPQAASNRQVMPLTAAHEPRRTETKRYDEMTADQVNLVVRCSKAGYKIPLVVGVLDRPYSDSAGLSQVAKLSTERALMGHEPISGCPLEEAVYWTRDQDGRGDYALRYHADPAKSHSVWWVPDEGPPTRRKIEAIPTRVYVDRLLRSAAYYWDVAEDKDATELSITRATQIDPGNKRVAEVWAELLMDGDPAGAVTHLTEFGKTHGSSPDLQATLAMALLATGESGAAQQATRLIEGVLADDPTHLKALSTAADRHRESGELEAALAKSLKLRDAHPSEPGVRYNLATLFLDLGREPEGLAELDTFLSVFPEDPDALFLRAEIRLRRGARDKAATDVKTLQRLLPGHPQVAKLAQKLAPAR